MHMETLIPLFQRAQAAELIISPQGDERKYVAQHYEKERVLVCIAVEHLRKRKRPTKDERRS